MSDPTEGTVPSAPLTFEEWSTRYAVEVWHYDAEVAPDVVREQPHWRAAWDARQAEVDRLQGENEVFVSLVDSIASFLWTDTFWTEFPMHAQDFLARIADLRPQWRTNPYGKGQYLDLDAFDNRHSAEQGEGGS